MLKHKPLAIAFIFFVILTFLSRYIPFFWDGVYFTKPAEFFYNNSYSTLVPPIEMDTGIFPLFGFYISKF
ncbi:MAG: hypothetical protein HXX09_14680 [Bacteroidetes bacterium]|nr:hypothetical protein [Bacteroidota bacterium]